MGLILLADGIRIPAADHVLDRVAHLLEHPPTESGGFWIAGQLEVERDGETLHPDPGNGHQRLWVAPGQIVRLVYDRPLAPDPDALPDETATVLV